MGSLWTRWGMGAAICYAAFICHAHGDESGPRQMEALDRGLVALRRSDHSVFLSWRLLGTDPPDTAFHVYRSQATQKAVRVSDSPLTNATCFVDTPVDDGMPVTYFVQPILDGVAGDASRRVSVGPEPVNSLTIPLQTLEGYSPNDASVGDLDGDGVYEIVLHQVGRGRDNSQSGWTTEPILEAYRLDGTMLWRINLGKNIREGAHYTQFLVYDFDGDGRAEIVCKTADGTIDGTGQVLGNAAANYRSQEPRSQGRVLAGPEFLTVFDGATGRALKTVDYIPPRGDIRSWGDDYGNRVDRFLACVAYLDGHRPSLVMCRGYYERTVLAAWNWRDEELAHLWTFDTDDGTPSHEAFRGQGNHSVSVADVDDDGRDEIVYGSCVIDDDGSGLYSTGMGHGDALHVTDIDPLHAGLEVFKANGDRAHRAGLELRDAGSGAQLFAIPSTGRNGVGRACALDLDPRYPGLELWGKGRGVEGLFSAQGQRISAAAPRICNMGVWWDGDLLRELLDGVQIAKWDYEHSREIPLLDGQALGCAANNGSKENPCLCADLFGDWREEVVARTQDNRALRIFSTTIPTQTRFVTLMHDPTYRLGIAWQNVGYNQPAHPGFFLGHGMSRPPRPAIVTPPAQAAAP